MTTPGKKCSCGTPYFEDYTLLRARPTCNIWLLIVPGDAATAKILLEAGADPNIADEYSPHTAGTTEALIQRIADFPHNLSPRADCRGMTPLHYAALIDSLSLLDVLMEAAADPTRVTKDGTD